MVRGRHRQKGDELCSIHDDKSGFTYPNYVHKKSGDVYVYPRIRHDDRTIDDHRVIDPTPALFAMEYAREKGEIAVFQYHRESKVPPKQMNLFKDLSIVILGVYTADKKIHSELKKLRKSRLKIKEVEWLLKDPFVKSQMQLKELVENLKRLLIDNSPPYYNLLVLYGDEARKRAYKIFDMCPPKTADLEVRKDRYGLMDRIQKRRNKKEYSVR
jgi:hypothetical protein